MKIRPRAGLAAGLLAALLLAGDGRRGGDRHLPRRRRREHVLERTTVTLPDTPPPVTSCNAHTAAAAIEVAHRRRLGSPASSCPAILGESHMFADSDYCAERSIRGAGRKRGAGICTDVLDAGDEVVMLADRSPAPTFASGDESVPARRSTGAPAAGGVPCARSPSRSTAYRVGDGRHRRGHAAPVGGRDGAGAVGQATTGADGRATLTLTGSGGSRHGVKADAARRQPRRRASPGRRCLRHVGARRPPPTRRRPPAAIAGIRDGQRFSRRRAPRELRGTRRRDPSGLWAVKIRLTRSVGKRCWYFSGTQRAVPQAHVRQALRVQGRRAADLELPAPVAAAARPLRARRRTRSTTRSTTARRSASRSGCDEADRAGRRRRAPSPRRRPPRRPTVDVMVVGKSNVLRGAEARASSSARA